MAKAVSDLVSPHPPCVHPPGSLTPLCQGVSPPGWSPLVADKEERVPGMPKEWTEVFLEGGPSSSGSPP